MSPKKGHCVGKWRAPTVVHCMKYVENRAAFISIGGMPILYTLE